MKKINKYAIIKLIIIIVSVLHSFNSFATEEGTIGPGSNIQAEDNYRVELGSKEYLGEENDLFWANWVAVHYGININAKLKPGDSVGSNIIYLDKRDGILEGDAAIVGYGLYQFLYNKHMVGYLYYLSDKVKDVDTTIEKSRTKDSQNNETIIYYKAREACKYVADRMISFAYSNDEKASLNLLYDTIIKQNKVEDIKKWESAYWYKVFGVKSFEVLTNKLGAENVIGGHEKDTKGALLSIMSDRYRNRSLQNKTDLQLKVDKGDLCPFLIYTTTKDKGQTTQWEYIDYRTKQYVKTTWDDMIKGAYQYMVYYEYKYDNEADLATDTNMLYNAKKAELFIEEYEELTDKTFERLSGEALDDFYQKVREVRRNYKKSKENGSLFGEDEEYSIDSDYTYSVAMERLAEKMKEEPFNTIFNKTLVDNIARTYLMAKNIAENERLTAQNAQYDIGSNILQRTPGGNDNTILLSDLQKIVLERDSSGGFTNDADEDGLNDGKELIGYRDVDITKFVEHMLKAESGLKDVSSLMQNYRNKIILDNETNDNAVEGQYDIYVNSSGKIFVKLFDYNSNPILKDTDFDGIDDGFGKENYTYMNMKKDEKPLDNNIVGNIFSTNIINILNPEFCSHMDYRYFFMDRFNYYDELSTMSLLLSNAIDKQSTGLCNINEVMPLIGCDNYMEKEVEAYDGGNLMGIGSVKYSVDYITAIKEIEYSKDNTAKNKIKKTVVPIIIKSPNEVELYNSYSEIGKIDWTNNSEMGEEEKNVKSYEIYAELLKENIIFYLSNNYDISNKDVVYWITGHKEAGAIANILAAKLIDSGKEVYCYTFGAPYTIYNNADETGEIKAGYRTRYSSIFNVVNEDDGYAFMMPHRLGFSRYGMTCYGSGRKELGNGSIFNPYTGKESSRRAVVEAMENLYKGYEDKTRTRTYNSNISKFLTDIMKSVFKYRIENEIPNDLRNKYKTDANKLGVVNAIIENITSLRDASDIRTYYYISKNMDNADITNVINLYDKKPDTKFSSIYDRFPCFQSEIELIGDVEIPMMFQSYEVWDNFKFGKNKETTIRKGGCSVSSLAMVLSWITKKEITPPDVRNILDNYKKNNYLNNNRDFSHPVMSEIPDFFDVVNLAVKDNKVEESDYDSFKSEDTLLYYLKKGKPLITRTDGGYLKTSGHFFVIAGIGKYDKNGNEITNIDTANKDDLLIYICDPKYSNQEKNSVCTKAFTFDQIKGRGADDLQATRFWVFDVDRTHKGEFTFKDGSEYIYEFNDVQCTSINQKYVDEYSDVLGVKGWKMP